MLLVPVSFIVLKPVNMEECELFSLFPSNFKLPNLKGDCVGALWYHQACKTVFPEILN